MDNEGLEFPDIWEVEDLYVSRLEEGSNKDDSSPKLDETLHSELYGSISPEEVKLCISEIERYVTRAGLNNISRFENSDFSQDSSNT